jgi:O-antigen/teichoic acid export membrane protein
MGVSATRYISLYRNQSPYKALQVYNFANKVTLMFSLVIGVVLFFASRMLATTSLHDASLSSTLQIGAFALFFLTLTATQTGTLNGFEDFKSIGIQASINGILQLFFIVLGAYFWGIKGAIGGIAAAAFFYWIQLHFAINPNVKKLKTNIVNEDRPNLLSIFVKFSLPSLLASIVFIPVVWWTKTFLIRHAGYGEMAVFDVSEQWYYILLFIPNSISSILLPMLTNTSVEGSKQQYGYLIKVNLYINVGITLILALFAGLLSPFINRLYGKDFTNYLPMIVMLVTAVFCAANNVFGQVIASKGKMWIGFGLNCLWATWLILFSFLLIGKMNLGALGLAYAMLISYFLHSIAQGWVAYKTRI